ncbi:MAG: response regulator, partial [Bacteroidales bacterium]|nr:response regulator [Bacteroidales bacterium]
IYCWEHNQHIIGIVVARIDLDRSLYKLLNNRVGLGETGETLIVNEDVLVLSQLRWYDNAPLNLHISAEPAINAANGKTGLTISADYRGEVVLAAYTYIPKTAWGFVCKQDLYELNAPIRDLIRNFAILFIISVLVVVLSVFWVIKRILRPIVNMNIAAKKIKNGDYTTRVAVCSRDEFATLANSINEMTASTESRIITQKGVADISETMIGQSSMQEFGSELLKELMGITGAHMSAFYILNEVSSEYEPFASVGANEELLKPFNVQNPEGEIGNALSKKSIYYLRNIPEDTIFKYKTFAGDAIPREIITIPVLANNIVVALISLVNIQKFSEECYDILKQSWAAINTSYSNLMASERTRVFAESLTRSNQQLEAQKEELQDQSEELQDQADELQQTSEELQEQNLELEAQRNHVEAANKLKSEFLSNMSHELRTPLNSIMALSRVLTMQAKDKLNDEENNYLEIIERNGKNLLTLINDILDLSKIEAGRMDVLPEFISIGSLLQIIKENMTTLSEERDLNLTLSIPDNLPQVETDESKLQQILTNIIGNAVKFTEKGSVDISVKHDQENIFIEVKDTGIGISKEMLPNIFDEFRQADGTSSRQFGGTGLGLAIANKMTEILGGNIKVKSKPGVGSVFTITIPIRWYSDKLNDDTNSSKIIRVQNAENKIPDLHDDLKIVKAVSETRILLVEDNPDAIIQLRAILEKEGYLIDVAGGGQQALDYLQHTIPDGVILDLMMPDIDGFEVLQKIKSNKKTKNIAVLILTAKDLNKEELEKLCSNNIQQLIHKGDVDIEGLLNKVQQMLENQPVLKSHIETSNLKPETSNLKPNVLIEEENLDNMTTIKAILKDKCNIYEAVDGEEGLKTAQSQLPDLILLDMALPKLSGGEVIKVLKENNKTKNIPVIAVTAQAMSGDNEKFIKAGCDGYIPKPIDQEALLAEIWRLLKK